MTIRKQEKNNNFTSTQLKQSQINDFTWMLFRSFTFVFPLLEGYTYPRLQVKQLAANLACKSANAGGVHNCYTFEPKLFRDSRCN